MSTLFRALRLLLIIGLSASLAGCDDPQVYGSVGVSSGYSSYGGYGRYNSGPRMRGSISVGGRIY
jgi:hypothetical protein